MLQSSQKHTTPRSSRYAVLLTLIHVREPPPWGPGGGGYEEVWKESQKREDVSGDERRAGRRGGHMSHISLMSREIRASTEREGLPGTTHPARCCGVGLAQEGDRVTGSVESTGSDAIWGLGGESWASSRCAVDYLRKKTAGEASSPRDPTAAEDINPEIPRISAEQLRSLLEEAEQCQRSHPRPPISKAKLAALLKDPYTTSFSHSGPFPADD
ncbi:unnamed protein product [Boreogadus saida]